MPGVFSLAEVAEWRAAALAETEGRDSLSYGSLREIIVDQRITAVAEQLLGGQPTHFWRFHLYSRKGGLGVS